MTKTMTLRIVWALTVSPRAGLLSWLLAEPTVAFAATPQQQPSSRFPTSLSFEELVERAQANSLERRQGVLQISRSSIETRLAERDTLPTAQLSSSLSSRIQPTPQPEREFEQQHAASLRVPLYRSGSQARVDASLARQSTTEAALREIDAQVLFDVVRQVSTLMSQRALTDITSIQNQVATQRLATMTRSYKRGERSELDITRATWEQQRAQILLNRAISEANTLERQIIDLAVAPATDELQTQVALKLPTKSQQDWRALFSQIERTRAKPSPNSNSPTRARLLAEREALAAELKRWQGTLGHQFDFVAGAGLAGSLTPLQPRATAQVEWVYLLPWNRMQSEEQELVMMQQRAIEEALADFDRRTQQEGFRIEEQVKSLRSELDDLDQQLEAQDRYQRLMRRRYDAGRASALELADAEQQSLLTRIERERRLSEEIRLTIEYAFVQGYTDWNTFFKDTP